MKNHDLTLTRRLPGVLRKNEVLLADRAYCGWTFLALLRRRGVEFVIRLHQARHAPRRIGSTQASWPKPQRKQRETRSYCRNLPRALPVRLVRFVIAAPGDRSRPVVVATSLLDRKALGLLIRRGDRPRDQGSCNHSSRGLSADTPGSPRPLPR